MKISFIFLSVYIDFHVAHLSLKQSKSFYTYKILFKIIIHPKGKKSIENTEVMSNLVDKVQLPVI